MTNAASQPTLRRRLGVTDAVLTGLGAMLGAGIFVTLAPVAATAGPGVLLALALAAAVAYCNARSSARLATVYPAAGGTYVYGREELGPFWGHLAGWSFVVGKTASCAAMALTAGYYLWPDQAHAVAVAAVVAFTALNCFGITKSAWALRLIVAVVVTVLLVVVVTGLTSSAVAADRLDLGGSSVTGVLGGAALWFFAFAGYARIATLGEEVRDPERKISRAITIAFAIVVTLYALVGITALLVVGHAALSESSAPLVDVVELSGHDGLAPVVRIGAAVAALGALLTLILGVSRTTLAMARDRYLPAALATVHPRYAVPRHAEVVVGVIVAVLVATLDVRGAIGFSAFSVLIYYAVANASAWSLAGRGQSRRGVAAARIVPALGFIGCLALGFSLSLGTVVAAVVVLAVGACAFAVSNRR
ncbi:amino acid/polyamine/organocation transporter (APC superfamily) [Williamsia limnetica]|uniref:Amino acid/polyamine/organocation transporter (APC superfamily) n=1 Tax=Williamsia limnetica TaxID=882452 RepID=A0A318RAS5_WILLI|nr:APC family permease [Williamsia limnetica]PYE12096.1 amino acid/polyamine/organocation transporter (APC superfamily) [Williamsia limnetica]